MDSLNPGTESADDHVLASLRDRAAGLRARRQQARAQCRVGQEILAIELQALVDLQFDVEITGFSLAEVDFAIEEEGEADPDGTDAPEDAVEFAAIVAGYCRPTLEHVHLSN